MQILVGKPPQKLAKSDRYTFKVGINVMQSMYI